MMFALAVAEVAIQFAKLMQEKPSFPPNLPAAYVHLSLALVVIATSWVGWSLAPATGARLDVKEIFQPEFLVLLIDVILVICYFVLVQSSPANDAFWVLVIFILYSIWDLLTKVAVYLVCKFRDKNDEKWFPKYAARLVPTAVCLALAFWTWSRFSETFAASHPIVVDAALIALILLFRAGKQAASAFTDGRNLKSAKLFAVGWVVVCCAGFLVAMRWPQCGCGGALDK